MEINLNGITKTYGNNENKIYALNGINLTVNSGESLAITGSSGSGKSTLLSIMSGLDIPTSGTVFADETDIFSLSENELTEFRRKHFGFVFQQFNLIPNFTAKENIELPLLFDKRKPDLEMLASLYAELEIENRLSNLPSELSGGQQQRVAIARALVLNPDIIFADEPTGNLDSVMGLKVINLLKKITAQRNKNLIIVTHDTKIASFAKRQITISDGEISAFKD